MDAKPYTEHHFEENFRNTYFRGATFYFTNVNTGNPIDLSGKTLIFTIRDRATSNTIVKQLRSDATSPILEVTDAEGGIVIINENAWLMSEFEQAGVYVWDIKVLTSQKIYKGGKFIVLEPVTKDTV